MEWRGAYRAGQAEGVLGQCWAVGLLQVLGSTNLPDRHCGFAIGKVFVEWRRACRAGQAESVLGQC